EHQRANHVFLCSFCHRRPRISTLFPYTTLFRSPVIFIKIGVVPFFERRGVFFVIPQFLQSLINCVAERYLLEVVVGNLVFSFHRSEEHTSELQSRENLVCRLLLEKKNNHCFLVL